MSLIERMTAWMDTMPYDMLMDIAPRHMWKELGQATSVHPFLKEYAGSVMRLYKTQQASALIPVYWGPIHVHFAALDETKEDMPFAFPYLQEIPLQTHSQAAYILSTVAPNPQEFLITIDFLSKKQHHQLLQQLVQI